MKTITKAYNYVVNKARYFLIAALVVAAIFSANIHKKVIQTEPILASESMSLDKRYSNAFVNGVFKDNILLTLAYLRGQIQKTGVISWDQVRQPTHFVIKLDPGKTFAYHDEILSPYQGKVTYTTHTHFSASEGFRSDGYLMGDGVCHLASLINWAAREAGLNVKAPVNHDFAHIPEVPQKYGVAIYSMPGQSASALQNLYVTNNREKPITFRFDFDGVNLKVSVLGMSSTLARINQ